MPPRRPLPIRRRGPAPFAARRFDDETYRRLLQIGNEHGWQGLADLASIPAAIHNWGARKLRAIPGVERAFGPARQMGYPQRLQAAGEERGFLPTEEPQGLAENVVAKSAEYLGPGLLVNLGMANAALKAAPAFESVMRKTLLGAFRPSAGRGVAEGVAMDVAAGAGAGATATVTDDPSLQMLAGLGSAAGVGNVLAKIPRAAAPAMRSRGPVPEAAQTGPPLPPPAAAAPDAPGLVPGTAATGAADPRRIQTNVIADQARMEHAALAAGRPLPARAGNINLEAMDSPAAIKRVLDQAAKTDDPVRGGRAAFAEQRRGVRTWDETQEATNQIRAGIVAEDEAAQALGHSVGMNADEILAARRTGTAWNAEWIRASTEMLDESSTRVLGAAQRHRLDPTEANAAAAFEEVARHMAIQGQVSGIRAEAGRALNIIKNTKRSRAQADAISKIAKMGGGGELNDELLGRLASLDNPTEMAAMIRNLDLVKPTRWKIVEAWMMGLLSGPQTHAVNITSNSAFNAVNQMERMNAAVLGGVRNLGRVAVGLPKQDRLYIRQVLAEMYGSIEGVRSGMYAAGRAWDTEMEGFALRTAATRGTGTLEQGMGAIKGEKGRMIRIPGRALQASDELFKGLAFEQRLAGLGARDAMEKGVSFRNYQKHIDDFVANPTKQALKDAQDHARQMTFTRDLGTRGKAAQKFINSSAFFKAIVPFLRTPVNLGKEGIYRNPFLAGFSKQMRTDLLGRNGTQAQNLAMSKLATGVGMALWALNEADQGLLKGRLSDDPSDQALDRARGNAPYSRLINGQWVSLNRLDPFSQTIGMTADLYGAYQRGLFDDDRWVKEAVPEIIKSFAEQMGNKTFLQGSSAAFKAYSDPDRYADSYLARMAASGVPGVLAQAARSADPTLRIEQGGDKTAARIPGARETVPARYDILGRPETIGDPDADFGARFISPFYRKVSKDAPVLQMMERVGARVPELGRVVEIGLESMPSEYRGLLDRDISIELPSHLYSEYERMAGEAVSQKLASEEPTLRRMKPQRARDKIERIFARERERVRRKLMKTLKDSGEIMKLAAKAYRDQERAKERL